MLKQLFISLTFILFVTSAEALDKQGASHKYSSANSEDMSISGSVSVGSSVYNKSYAARPDNSGLALLRYAAHSDFDILGPKLSIPLDLNMFTDRTDGNNHYFTPSELDIITGVTSTRKVGEGQLEIGARYEDDRPLNSKSNFKQTYSDVRARYYKNTTSFTLGWFVYNPSYAARPDNTGLALLRLGAHKEFSLWKDAFYFGIDGTTFTDRNSHSGIRLSELDTTLSLIYRCSSYEIQLGYENDRPIDGGSFVQDLMYVFMSFPFQALN